MSDEVLGEAQCEACFTLSPSLSAAMPVKNGSEEWPGLMCGRKSHEYADHTVGSTEWMHDKVG